MAKQLSKRERNIFIGVIAVCGLWVADQYALTPYMERRAEIAADSERLQTELQRSNKAIVQGRRDQRRWAQSMAPGLKADASAAEGQMHEAIRAWAQETGLNLSSVKSDPPEQDKQFRKIMFRATGTGSLSSISRFLFRIEASQIPARTVDVQLAARKEGTDDLSMTLAVSTLCLGPQPTTAQANVAGSVVGGGTGGAAATGGAAGGKEAR